MVSQKRYLCVLITALSLPFQQAFAQEEYDDTLEEVRVTGSRALFSTADDAPVPISVLSNETLTTTGATELGRAI